MTNYELIDAHVKATGFCSIMGHMKDVSPTYDKIVEKGNDIVPDILEYLRDKDKGMNVMILLWDITKVSPYTPEKIEGTAFAGFNVSEARQAWIKWGIENKYINEIV